MPHLSRAVLGIAILLILVGRAAAVVPEIKDDGKFFSPDAIKKANEVIREIYLKTQHDLLIETFATVPADQAEKVKSMDAKEKSDFFRKWAIERAKQAGVNGIYILICKDPTYFWIEPSRRVRQVFDSKKYAKLRELIVDDFREKRFDAGLQNAVKYVRDQLVESK